MNTARPLPLFAVAAMLPLLAAMDGAFAQAADAPAAQTAHRSCVEIRTALSALASSEREQALALSLSRPGAPATAIELKLNELLARTEDLRGALRRARQGALAHDQHVEQCIAAGSAALVDAEKLGSEVQAIVLERRGYVGPLTPPASPVAPSSDVPAVRGAPAPAAPR